MAVEQSDMNGGIAQCPRSTKLARLSISKLVLFEPCSWIFHYLDIWRIYSLMYYLVVTNSLKGFHFHYELGLYFLGSLEDVSISSNGFPVL